MAVQAFPEALEVAEALVLLPEVDSVTAGRQMYTVATAQELQVCENLSVPCVPCCTSVQAKLLLITLISLGTFSHADCLIICPSIVSLSVPGYVCWDAS